MTSDFRVKQIKSAFYSLSKVFSESRIVEYNIKENILPHGRREVNNINTFYIYLYVFFSFDSFILFYFEIK